jgi:hypothetical protein
MNLKRTVLLTLGFFLSFCVIEASGQWLHVRVEEAGKGESVRINVPLALVETVLPLVKADDFERGTLKIDSGEFTVVELREVWEVVKAEGSYEFAAIDSRTTQVRVALEEDYLVVRSLGDSEKEVLVTIPIRVVDALLSSGGNELDVRAAVAALSAAGHGELVRVKDGDTSVRVWIDGSSSGR